MAINTLAISWCMHLRARHFPQIVATATGCFRLQACGLQLIVLLVLLRPTLLLSFPLDITARDPHLLVHHSPAGEALTQQTGSLA